MCFFSCLFAPCCAELLKLASDRKYSTATDLAKVVGGYHLKVVWENNPQNEETKKFRQRETNEERKELKEDTLVKMLGFGLQQIYEHLELSKNCLPDWTTPNRISYPCTVSYRGECT